ncbi:hypothetical protein CN172_12780 [Sinorhizobium meliloti]|nr:hypothetical protein [Sinorhizobium meliloti]MDX0012858.1 hypothetical protein [Sinorhizobium meliloti]MDX0304945.1 hypothetical protein [Sinorhizobium meliloti]MDX0373411.1 hypothetical protein [Sinorhizobium meliloti]MQX41717.1 hypothetical protein [Sinorhizobium meliloti]RMC65836.1 hypothetical protein EBB04_17860 [Sinorhizobium meliloti]
MVLFCSDPHISPETSPENAVSEFISYLFAILVIGPLQAEISERLRGVPSTEIVQAGRACVAAEAPRLLQRAQEDWGWAAANAVGVSVGLIDPASLLAGQNADCDRLVQVLSQSSGGNGDDEA